MRLLPFVATIAFFAASSSAFAADCTKGLLWPYTRNPGDCLTDVEIKAGKTGVYTGPMNTNVDVSSIKPDTSIPSSGGGGGSTGGYFSGGLIGELTGGSASTPSSNAVSCNKGYLWPFLREPGDCLTATEKLTDKTGVYRGGEVTQASASNVPTSNAEAASNPPPASTPPPPPATSAPACDKGLFWPFVRKSGDCPTATDKPTNKAAVYRDAEATPVSASKASAGGAGAGSPQAVAPLPAASSASPCQKSLFWPFVRASGDCPTDTDKQANKDGVYRGAVTPVSASNAPAGDTGAANTPVSAPPPPASSAPACEKGWLWPFVRKSGDCPTDTDKK